MKQGIGRALFFSLIVLSLLGTCSALSACNSETSSATFTFTNTKDNVQHYSLLKSGVPASWTDASPFTFSLYPGKSQSVVAFINVPSSVREGVYTLTLTAKSDEGDSITKTEEVFVSSCHVLSLSAASSSFNACINQDFFIPLTVRNHGNFVEHINLSTSYGVLDQSFVILPLNDSQVVNLVVKSGEIGSIPLVITAESESARETLSFIVNMSECVSFSASLSENYVNLCENEEKDIFLNINSNGGDFFINTSSSFFVDVPSSIQATSGSFSRSFRVYSGCETGVFNPGLKIWTAGSSVAEVPLVLNLRGCFQPIVVGSVENDAVCACERISYGFDVYNPGTREITYSLSPSHGKAYINGLEVSQVTIPVNGSARVIVNYTIPCDYSGVFDLSLNATAIQACVKSFSDSINVRVNSWSACETVNIDGPSIVSVNDSEFTVPVRVSNVGLRNSSYSLLVSGTAANNLLGISKSFLTIEPGKSELVELVFNPSNITGNYITVQALSTDNLASSSKVINFGNGFSFNSADLYYILIPAGVTVLLLLFLARGKVFKKSKALISVDEKNEEVKVKPEPKSGKSGKK